MKSNIECREILQEPSYKITTLVSSLYSSGYVIAISGETSLSNTRENTGKLVYTVA